MTKNKSSESPFMAKRKKVIQFTVWVCVIALVGTTAVTMGLAGAVS